MKVCEEIVKLVGKADMYFFSPEHPLTEEAQRALDWLSSKSEDGESPQYISFLEYGLKRNHLVTRPEHPPLTEEAQRALDWAIEKKLKSVREEIVKLLEKADMYFFSPEHPPLTEEAQRALDWDIEQKLKSGNISTKIASESYVSKAVLNWLPALNSRMRSVSLELEILGRHQHPELTVPFLKVFL
ncbi:hypothetical protein POM88_023165 [Heracleum sosnowskyi]|uniref:Uncharacterized protein n=1 Tax=Heracleum sosnowskyi TaxID=360622 RepID=A0AAD8IGS0_9APIA|nr:hypothetical protein POM88_023165 [Heracleum sosnowskyi]